MLALVLACATRIEGSNLKGLDHVVVVGEVLKESAPLVAVEGDKVISIAHVVGLGLSIVVRAGVVG